VASVGGGRFKTVKTPTLTKVQAPTPTKAKKSPKKSLKSEIFQSKGFYPKKFFEYMGGAKELNSIVFSVVKKFDNGDEKMKKISKNVKSAMKKLAKALVTEDVLVVKDKMSADEFLALGVFFGHVIVELKGQYPDKKNLSAALLKIGEGGVAGAFSVMFESLDARAKAKLKGRIMNIMGNFVVSGFGDLFNSNHPIYPLKAVLGIGILDLKVLNSNQDIFSDKRVFPDDFVKLVGHKIFRNKLVGGTFFSSGSLKKSDKTRFSSMLKKSRDVFQFLLSKKVFDKGFSVLDDADKQKIADAVADVLMKVEDDEWKEVFRER